MTLYEGLHKGDWVRASAKNGSVIEAQAAHDMATFGAPGLGLIVAGNDGDAPQAIVVNVNHWDVTPLRRNLLADERRVTPGD